MAFCSNCGTQIDDGVKFCPSCGQPAGAAYSA
ncbi:MAG: zinc-ribbon domain-containing protein [Oscillospiraceae bacterium]|nr:zinc-ribbon domain-containing protein [Oscillospiraceae bacterium]